MASLRIDIASEFTGAKAFTKANKASTGLEKGIKKLGVAMVAAFSVQAITQFGKAAVKAFMEDEKAAATLANTLKNLGLDFAVASNEQFISSLEKSTNVADDKLRPALSGLITQTGSLTYAQDLLAKAIEISRGSGVALETVTDDLGKAFVGNTKGLAKGCSASKVEADGYLSRKGHPRNEPLSLPIAEGDPDRELSRSPLRTASTRSASDTTLPAT